MNESNTGSLYGKFHWRYESLRGTDLFLNSLRAFDRIRIQNGSKEGAQLLPRRTFSWDTLYIYIYIYIRARASIKHEKLPSASARAHKCPDPSTKHIRTHMTAKANKERALATSNAATASACAPLYVSQGRHVRLRTTYLYLCCFVHDRPDARTFPSAEIGRPASRVSRRFTERPNPSFLLSSGSSPRRVMAHWLIDWTLLRPDDLTLNSFYSRIRAMCILD